MRVMGPYDKPVEILSLDSIQYNKPIKSINI